MAQTSGDVDGTTTFAGIISLEGDAGDNEFEFGLSGSLDGDITGGGGADEIDIILVTGANNIVDLTTSQISGVLDTGTFSGIGSFMGDNSADTLISSGTKFNIDGANSGDVDGTNHLCRVHQSRG